MNNLEINEVYSFKMNSGEEMVAKVVEVVNGKVNIIDYKTNKEIKKEKCNEIFKRKGKGCFFSFFFCFWG